MKRQRGNQDGATMIHDLPESRESLLLLVAGPTVWGIHFLASYGTAAVWCAKFAGADRSLAAAQVAIIAYTVVAIVVLAGIGWHGWRRHRLAESILPHDTDSPEDRHRFLGFATFLLAGLSTVAVLYEVASVILVGSCW